jgi:NADH:ubiquinone oxidoreductase subunit F (NADH-binding)
MTPLAPAHLVAAPFPTTGTGRLLLPGATDRLGLTDHLAYYGPLPALDRWSASVLFEAVDAAGLTGRGGAGFPTARKLRAVAAGRRRPVVVANGMESEPDSRKDQTLLARVPHLVLDGALLAARALGARDVHLCLPDSRPHLHQSLQQALAERRAAAPDRVRITVHALPHRYVSSEATSLVHWLNGGPAVPLSAPPRTHEKGVAGRPTLVQNVETLAHLALIARYGPDWFRAAGTADATGTTLITLAGAVHHPGVYEIEPGTPIRTVLDRAGGLTGPVQALLVGGYAGTWLPLHQTLDLPFSRSGLAPAGAAPGAGVIKALPLDACGLAETARMLRHLAAGSADQCGPCRFGLPAVADDLTALADGRPDPGLPDRLERRIGLLPDRGGCRLPDGGARLAASALRVFVADVERHLRRGPCGRPDTGNPLEAAA